MDVLVCDVEIKQTHTNFDTIKDLESAQCIVIEDEISITPLTLGRIASYYYLHYTTVKLFNDEINENSALQDLLSILCNASEYAELPVRHNEVCSL